MEKAFEGESVEQMKISLDTSNPGIALVLRCMVDALLFVDVDVGFDVVDEDILGHQHPGSTGAQMLFFLLFVLHSVLSQSSFLKFLFCQNQRF